MTIEQLRQTIPAYAKDVKLNLGQLLTQADQMGLTEQQVAGIALASAYTTQQRKFITALENHYSTLLDDVHIDAAKAAAAIMAMNNVYYRFIHLVEDKSFASLPAKLRMNVMANSGIDKVDFELYALAISALNGCGLCMDSHVKSLKKLDASQLAIQGAIRIAAVVQSVAQVLGMQLA